MLSDKKEETRLAAEANFEIFVRLVQPQNIIGSCHSELMAWMTREDKKHHQLVLMPRAHRKSYYAGLYAAWKITRNPAIKILYISSASNLATKQLKAIKDILTSDTYRYYWPEMVNEDEGRREKWTEKEISVDHPKRKEEGIRDPTVFTAGLTTSIVGLHCGLNIMDDVVTQQNAWTEEGREKVRQQYSLLAAIEDPDAEQLITGTRYHPNDLYGTLLDKKIQIYSEEGDLIEESDLYEVFLRQVETRGDGTGEYLWPRQQRSYDGQWFGFNQNILATKKSQFLDQVSFRAQYYNNPNDTENAPIQKDSFQYYDRSFLSSNNGVWYYKHNRLNVFASIDFAYSLSKKADYTSIVVVGVDGYSNYYVLDIDRFKTDLVSEYYRRILSLHQKWQFKQVKAEVSVAQKVIVTDLKQNYIRPNGIALSIKEFNPTRLQGTKEERINSILEPRYNNRQIWHYQGGHCQTLEEELVLNHPPHDDIKDALATCVDFCIAPSPSSHKIIKQHNTSRFGGHIP